MFKKIFSSSLVSAGLVYTIGNLFIRGISFITLPIFARIMSTSEFGEFNNFVSLAGIFTILMGLSVNSSVINATLEFKEKMQDYLSSITFLALLVSGIFFVLGNLYFLFNARFFELNHLLFNLMLIQAFSLFMVNMLQSYFTIKAEKFRYLILSLASTFMNLAVSLVFMLVFFTKDKYTGRAFGSTLGMAVIAMVILFLIFSKGKALYHKPYWKYALALSLPIIPHSLSNVILGQFDRIMLTNMSGNEVSGIYSFYSVIASILSIVWSSINTAWVPWFYQKMAEKSVKEIQKMVKLYAMVFLILTVGFMTMAMDVGKLAGGEKYFSGISLIIPITLGFYFQFLYSFPVNLEFYLKKTKIIAIGTVISALLNIGLNFLFIPKYGAVAASFTTTFTYFTLFVAHYTVAKKLGEADLFPLKIFIRDTLILLVFSSLMYLVLGNIYLRYLLMLFSILAILWINKHLWVNQLRRGEN